MGQARSLAPFQAKVTHAEHLGYTNVSVEKQYSSDIYSGCSAISEKHFEFYGRIVWFDLIDVTLGLRFMHNLVLAIGGHVTSKITPPSVQQTLNHICISLNSQL